MGNLWNLGDSFAVPSNCSTLSLHYPQNFNTGENWTSFSYEDSSTVQRQILGTGISRSGYSDLVQIRGTDSDGVEDEFLNATFGSVIYEAQLTVEGVSVSFNLKRDL